MPRLPAKCLAWMVRARLLFWCLPPLLGACASLADLGDERSQGTADAAAVGSNAGMGTEGAGGSAGTGGSAGADAGTGSNATSLGTFPVQPRYLAMGATPVYVSTTAGEVHRIPRTGGSSQKLFSAGTSTWAIAAGQSGTFGMVLGGDYLYWMNQGTYGGT